MLPSKPILRQPLLHGYFAGSKGKAGFETSGHTKVRPASIENLEIALERVWTEPKIPMPLKMAPGDSSSLFPKK